MYDFYICLSLFVCLALVHVVESVIRHVNPRHNPHQPPILLRNATVYNGLGVVAVGVDIQLKQGLITAISVGRSLSVDDSMTLVYDLHGRVVTPGLVDMHR
jgi:imidazolonepropionase-like amidohydrolase